MSSKIDVVITWVDGNDAKWRQKKQLAIDDNTKTEIDARECRYRDWGTLKYILRGIEKNMPWINNIFLITDSQRPNWLKETKKLIVIDHKDFIPKKYLPTFNSNTIELNLYRIQNLSEKFILFNDDMFVISPIKETEFFQGEKPKDQAILKPIDPIASDTESYKTKALMVSIINKHFDKRKVIKAHPFLWFNVKYGKRLYSNITLYPYKYFSGFYDNHLPLSHVKNTFNILWNEEYSTLDATCRYKTRDYANNVSHWLIRYWNIVTGNFSPRNNKIGKSFIYGTDSSRDINEAIKKQKYKLICINDSDHGFNFEIEKKRLVESFETILPDKSSFEK